VTSVRTVNTKRSAKQFARGHRGGILTTTTLSCRKIKYSSRDDTLGSSSTSDQR